MSGGDEGKALKASCCFDRRSGHGVSCLSESPEIRGSSWSSIIKIVLRTDVFVDWFVDVARGRRAGPGEWVRKGIEIAVLAMADGSLS